MARDIDTNEEVDPNLVAAIAGRSTKTIRDDADTRIVSRGKRGKFDVPKELIPKGWVVEWKRKSCLGKEEEADYFMDLEEAGWKPASLQHFRKLMPSDYQGKTVERGGMILMTRPLSIQDGAKKLAKEEAFGQVRDKITEIGMTGKDEMKRVVTKFDRKYSNDGAAVPGDNE
jgi:hypothetical protein